MFALLTGALALLVHLFARGAQTRSSAAPPRALTGEPASRTSLPTAPTITSSAPSSSPPSTTAEPAETEHDEAARLSAPADPSTFLVRLERGACYGPSPVYALTIDGDGNVTFEGAKHVRTKGRRTHAEDRRLAW